MSFFFSPVVYHVYLPRAASTKNSLPPQLPLKFSLALIALNYHIERGIDLAFIYSEQHLKKTAKGERETNTLERQVEWKLMDGKERRRKRSQRSVNFAEHFKLQSSFSIIFEVFFRVKSLQKRMII